MHNVLYGGTDANIPSITSKGIGRKQMRHGVELWNRPDMGTPEEQARVIALGPSVVKIRGYHPLALIDWLLTVNPDMLFIVRSDVDGSFVLPITVLNYLTSKGIKHIYILDSEPNQQDSFWRNNFDGYLDRLRLHVDEVHRWFPATEICSPPMAIIQEGQVDIEWYKRLLDPYNQMGILFDGLHVYWQGDNYTSPDWGRRIEQYATIASGADWVVDELGDSSDDKPASERAEAIIDVLTYLYRRGDVQSACLFLACGGTADWSKYVLPLAECQRIGDAMQKLNSEEVPEVVTVVADEKMRMYADWSLARLRYGEDPRDVSAFITHLKALGADWEKPHLHGLPYVEVLPKA